MVANGKVVTLGHCKPDAETIQEAVRRGASMVTHFGNGAAPMIHRFNNPFWSFLAEERLALGLICDGHHLPPDLLKVAFSCKQKKTCIPVSDASGYSGFPPGPVRFQDGRTVVISDDGKITVAGKDILSGAWFQLDRAVEYLASALGFSFPDAWRQCSIIPAEWIGIPLPQLSRGDEATFVVADWRQGRLSMQRTLFGGIEFRRD
jgi:N-acetylglucosamine-6-phosphate deacetylase